MHKKLATKRGHACSALKITKGTHYVLKIGLILKSLVSIETKGIACPKKENWLKNGGNPREHAHQYVSSLRERSNTTFISGEMIKALSLVYSFSLNLA